MKREEKPTLYDLVGAIYDAGLHPEHWQPTYNQLLSHFNSRRGGFFSSELRLTTAEFPVYAGAVDWDRVRLYKDYFASKDLRTAALVRQSPGAVSATNLFWEDRVWRNTEYYCDYFRQFGDYYYGGTALLAKNGHRATVAYFNRRKKDGEWTGDELERLRLLAPHLARAFQTSKQLAVNASEKSALAALLERSRYAVFLLNEQGLVVLANRRAEHLLRERRDIRMAQSQLAVTGALRQAQLADLVRESIRTATGQGLHPGGRMAIEPEDSTPGMTILVTPLNTAHVQGDFARERICAAVYVSVPSKPELSEAVLVTCFSLTRAEAKVAAALARGLSPKEIGSALHIATNTAYNHLRAIYAKTGTGRQAELVQLLLSSPAADAGLTGAPGDAA
jgi:DNA-binding CsgD family transcriptional regulator/PAS domain-containing protein